ncbi:hypothetical protein HK105_203440 [Polyrhizophydium stewartii]|uniref:Ankyrin repeat protein n=1 Tax=Polyrhizophydium stewartii TaxID=2732419 RepID=A0ABR4NBV0_9FUNG
MATPSFQQTRAEEEKRRRIQAEDQRIAELQQHPPTPPLPAEASHWDRLPAELHDMIIKVSSHLTKLAVGAMTPDQLEAASNEEKQQAWEDAFATDWQGNLGLLPDVFIRLESFLIIQTRSMLARVESLNLENVSNNLRRCAIAREWRDLIDIDSNPAGLAEDAAAVGALWLLRELIDERRAVEPSERMAKRAARCGRIEIVKFLHERMPDGSWSQSVATAAIVNGHLDVADWLLANRNEGCDPARLSDMIGMRHPDSYVKVVVERGLMEVDERAVCEAAESGSVELMQYLRTRGGDELFTNDLIDEAANNGLEMLQWLHREFGFVPTTWSLSVAAERHDVVLVRWLLETFPDVDWDIQSAYEFTMVNHKRDNDCLPVLMEWAAQHGRTFDD